MGDVWALYRIDVTHGSPYNEALVVTLLARLGMEPNSLYRAKRLGGEEWFGYGFAGEVMMQVADEVRLNTKAAAQRKASLKAKEMRPRPSARDGKLVVSSRDSAAASALARMINGG